MEDALHRFVRLLRLHGLRIGVSETVDAMQAAATPGIVADRELLRNALRVCLVKDRRDEAEFDKVFDRFFLLRAVFETPVDHGHSHAHDDLDDGGTLDQFTLSEEPGDTPQDSHTHGKPADIKDFFNPEDMAQQYNLHQEANKLDMAALTNEIVLSNDTDSNLGEAARVQLSTSRMHNPGRPGEIADRPGVQVDAELTVAQEMALLDWLEDSESGAGLDSDDLVALKAALAGLLDGLPEKLRQHLEKLMAGEKKIESDSPVTGRANALDEVARADLEESVRRLIRSLHGGPRARRKVAAKGSVDGARTMRASLRYDGVPFRPVTVAKVADRPRLLLLTDVSLSVRSAASFTLQLVHGLQSLTTHVRSFAFVADLVEISDLFDEHQPEVAVQKVMAGLPAGGVLDVDADSDYGTAFGTFLEEFGTAINRRSTVIVLGDGRGNGKDPNFRAFEEIARRARETVWLTSEPRYSWGLGSCDLPGYATFCDKVQVVRDLAGLERVTEQLQGGSLSGGPRGSVPLRISL